MNGLIKQKLIGSVALIMIAAIAAGGCAKPQSVIGSSDESSVPSSSEQGSSPAPGEIANPDLSWSKVDMNGYPSNGTDGGKLVLQVDQANQALIFLLPLPANLPVMVPATAIPQLPGAAITMVTDTSGKQRLALKIPFRYIIKGANLGPGQTLPNGDPLPFVPAGELPGFSINLPQLSKPVHIYIGVNVAAVFFEVKGMNLPIGLLYPVKNKDKTKVIGAIGYIPDKGSYNGGMYLAAQLPTETAQLIDNLIQW